LPFAPTSCEDCLAHLCAAAVALAAARLPLSPRRGSHHP